MRYGYFDSEIIGTDSEGMPIFDRAEHSDLFQLLLANLVSNGVLALPGDCFQVMAGEGLKVTVRPGFGLIKGVFAYDDAENTLTLDTAPVQYSRIDRIVLRCNYADRLCELAVKPGIVANTPVAPEIVQPASGDFFELGLATIVVGANVTAVTQADITDTRGDSSVCGFITQLIDHLDTSVFYAQLTQFYAEFQKRVADYEEQSHQEYSEWYEALKQSANGDMDAFNQMFDEWFQHMKDQLSEDAAGALQLEVDELKELVAAATSHCHTLDAKAASWQEQEDGSFEQTFEVEGITEAVHMSGDVVALVEDGLTVDEKSDIASALGGIGSIKTGEGTVTLVCFSGAPEMDLNIIVTEVK